MSREWWTSLDWAEAFEERAAFLEYAGGYDRATAEAVAREEINAQRSAMKPVAAIETAAQGALFGDEKGWNDAG
jgi:hypothetical protein